MNWAPNVALLAPIFFWLKIIGAVACIGFLALLFEVHVDNDGSLDKKIRRWWQQ